MQLEGVRVGPLNPDRGEMFGQVGGIGSPTAARALLRHHQLIHPPALIAALNGSRQEARSLAMDRDELEAAVERYYDEADEALPDGAEITGSAVKGEDDARSQFVTFTWVVSVENGGSGRSGKGFVPYTDEYVPRSIAAGNHAVRVAKLKEAGLPWTPDAVQAEAAGIPGTGVPVVDTERERIEEENEQLAEDKAALEYRLAALETQLAELLTAKEPEPPQDAETPEPGLAPPSLAVDPHAEPWPGYEVDTADKIRARLKNEERPVVEAVLAYEMAHNNRTSVVGAANQILDRSPAA